MNLQAKSVYDSLAHIEQVLAKYSRVFYTRFGDGEIFILNEGGTIDHQANVSLTRQMKEVWQVEDQLFLKGVAVQYPVEKGMIDGVLAPFPDTAKLQEILLQHGATAGTQYENFIVFHYLSLFDPERMQQFLNTYVRPKRKMFIGSSDPQVLKYLFGEIDVYIPTPAHNAYSSIEEGYPKVEKHIGEVDVVLPAAGAASKIVQLRLWQSGANVHSLDMGSVADVVQLRGTRRWIRLLGHRSRQILLPGWQSSGLFTVNPVKNLVSEAKYRFHQTKQKLRE